MLLHSVTRVTSFASCREAVVIGAAMGLAASTIVSVRLHSRFVLGDVGDGYEELFIRPVHGRPLSSDL